MSLIVGCGLLADGWLCLQHLTECIDTGEIVVQVEVEACWLWSWDCCLLTWQGDKVKWHFLKRECVQGGEGGWGGNRFPIRLTSKQFQMLPHTPHPDLKYILGTVSFSFSCYKTDFHQVLDLCSCVMRSANFWWALWQRVSKVTPQHCICEFGFHNIYGFILLSVLY